MMESSELVVFRGGAVAPWAVVAWLLDLEARGIPLQVDANHRFIVPSSDPRLTDADRAGMARWRHHLRCIVEHRPPEVS